MFVYVFVIDFYFFESCFGVCFVCGCIIFDVGIFWIFVCFFCVDSVGCF